MDQAIAAYKLLAGPKRLYLGDIGHAPAKNPSAEAPTYLTEAVGWFEQYLAGGPKLVGGGVELAHDPWDGKTTFYKSLPGTRRTSVNLPGNEADPRDRNREAIRTTHRRPVRDVRRQLAQRPLFGPSR